MKRIFIVLISISLALVLQSGRVFDDIPIYNTQSQQPSTWSIVAVDPTTGEVGSAGASCESYAVGILGIVPGKGVLVAQGAGNGAARWKGLEMLGQGASPQDIVAVISSPEFDADHAVQQYGVAALGFENAPSAYTGEKSLEWRGDVQGVGVSVQGNVVVSEEVITAALAAFNAPAGIDNPNLVDRLIAGLEAGADKGGDKRCGLQTAISAYLVVAKPEDSAGSFSYGIVIPGQKKGGKNAVSLLRDQYEQIGQNEHRLRILEDDLITTLILFLPPLVGTIFGFLLNKKNKTGGSAASFFLPPIASLGIVWVLRLFKFVFRIEQTDYFISLLVVAVVGGVGLLLVRKAQQLFSNQK